MKRLITCFSFLLSLLLFGMPSSIKAAGPLLFGQDAPDFMLKDQEGYTHSLYHHRGKFIFLFFYQRDFTIPSAREIRNLQKHFREFYDRDIVVYGISNDNVSRHRDFHNKFHLAFDLLSDPNEEAIEAYGAKRFVFTRFISYLIGPDGRVFRSYDHSGSKSLPVKALEDIELLEQKGQKFSL